MAVQTKTKWMDMNRLIIVWMLLTGGFISACSTASGEWESGRLEVNGTELYVTQKGDGEPLIVLHGGPGLSHDYFLPHIEPLSEEFRLILFDQRGMGRSSVELDSDSFSMQLLIEDIEALRKELGFETIHLMGHSWGGIMAMHYAVAYPESLSSLILCNSMPATSEFDELLGSNFAQVYQRQRMSDLEPLQRRVEEGSRDITLHERLMQLQFRPAFYDTADGNRLHLNLQESYFRTQELLPYLQSGEQPAPLYPSLRDLQLPVLILRGEMEAIPVEADLWLLEILPDASLVSIDRAGHFPFIEQPEEFMVSLTGFLRGFR